MKGKIVIYHVFTRLFGNTNTTNKPWGTIEENGVGKFADFSDKALAEIKDLGISHIWYTGVPHHAVIRDYTDFGISNDDANVVKGRAGSPYAVKDYYNVNPDLATDPAKRLEDFKALIDRTHKHGIRVIIDIVPNHVARNYEGISNPEGVSGFGVHDDTSLEYKKDNNFYYIPNSVFQVPDWHDGYQPLGGENHKAIGTLEEKPAKWTGNGARSPKPDMNDWYETVRINYGVRPDGEIDFDLLPYDFGERDYKEHFNFWKHKEVPNSWIKFRDIALFWLDLGVDGFRYDMAEMVPVEFWSFMNSSIKMKNEDTFLMAEVYNPDLYRTFIHKGKMDYLYDKVDFYDGLKHIMKGYGWSDHIPVVQNGLKDIEHHMLHFLENHDEQRIASPEFVGKAEIAKPAMVVSATISTSPTMIYFGQEVGEPAAENPGFGSPSRTSIFDYVGVPNHQRWVNDKKFDGGQLSSEERGLRDFYKRVLNFTLKSEALMGNYREIHFYNKELTQNYNHRVLSYVRWSKNQKLIVIANFDVQESFSFELKLPVDLIEEWELKNEEFVLKEMLYGGNNQLKISNKEGFIDIHLAPLESLIFEIQ
ncbi:alpha-amylase family glycosyl hydrolase [Maribacter sp. PR1]|uniref:Alpha-amylase family glycosyl hydrolase n=1 Tax=Maribacter cobaltidurans TaxID=1178778 RepID=A0ABU7IRS3_9FLAO|nr:MULTISPECIES: alpha-amylase family glycosyl hydrolase [Maribacter]MDC6388277.1 alpha-amylase family glycosyl hydrolase [Maribacter sp. PR1]MEE1975666.1 alpha-amylase family glycosyl hydrolase [Maribacter cobaltidurans]